MKEQSLRWLKSIGLKVLEKPFEHKQTGTKFHYLLVMSDGTEMYYTKEYLSKTPLKELKAETSRCGVMFSDVS